MNNNFQNLEDMVESLLSKEVSPSQDHIRQMISKCQVEGVSSVSDDDAEKLARIFEERHGVTMSIGAVLTATEYEPWLENARAEIEPYYWERYRKLLVQQHFSSHVLATINSVTDRTLGLLENPLKDGPWDRRGMVVGHVQSGKTANYTGLICKAADAGYKLIVVIAGIHNSLRNQTQLRIDEGFVGRDSARLLMRKKNKFVGVGRFDRARRPLTLTNSVRDFNKAMATGTGIPFENLNEPAVLVIKKNASTLQNLLEWLQEHSASGGEKRIDIPMLLIDDEADNASINIKHSKGDISRINGQIRELLKMFDRSCYVGYTATPFANIFVDPNTSDEMLGEDLFPRHFIVSLDPPSNYFGADRVFLEDDSKIVRHIKDNEEVLPLKHKIDQEIYALPQSLIDAVRAFIVARSIRLNRGQVKEHCSMLVNASRFTGVQRQISNEIKILLEKIQASARVYGSLEVNEALQDEEIEGLNRVWEAEYKDTEFDWFEIQKQLHEAAAPVQVVEVNSTSSGALNYKDNERNGLNVIAVGGFSLSRGLTIEGLIVSYFLRNSMMYDTLMQMGRWFGYRPNYDDLCRIWMLEEAEGWYTHITESIELLRQDLRNMEAAGATPEEFGLKVRSHPDTLIITARNKMGSGERFVVKVGLDDKFIETSLLKRDSVSLEANFAALNRFRDGIVEKNSSPSKAEKYGAGSWLLRNVPVDPIVGLVSDFTNHPGALLTDTSLVSRYIKDRSSNELARWDILFAGIGRNSDTIKDDSMGIPIYCQLRTAGDKTNSETLHVGNRQRVATRGIEKAGLTPDVVEKVQRDYKEKKKKKGDINYPDFIYRAVRKRPLLIIHLLDIKTKDGRKISRDRPVVAWSISFPSTELKDMAEYVVNTTWLRENYSDDVDEDEIGGDDE